MVETPLGWRSLTGAMVSTGKCWALRTEIAMDGRSTNAAGRVFAEIAKRKFDLVDLELQVPNGRYTEIIFLRLGFS